MHRSREANWIYVSAQYMRPGEGSYTHINGVVKALRRRHHKVKLFYPEHDPNSPPTIVKRIIAILALHWSVLRYILDGRRRAKRRILYLRAHLALAGVGVIGRMLGYTVVVELNGLKEDNYRAWPQLKWIRKLVEASRRTLFSSAHLLVCVSEIIERQVIREGLGKQTKTVVIPNGTDTELFRPRNRSESCSLLSLDPDLSYLVFVGAFAEFQNIPLLLDTIMETGIGGNLTKSWQVLFAGAGALEDRVREADRTNDHVRYVGRVPHEQVPHLISASTAGLMLHDSDGRSPLKLYEYLACQRPVICTDVDAADLIRETNAGWIVSDRESLRRAIESALSLTHDDARAMAREGTRLVHEQHSWDKVAEDIEDAIRRLAE